MNIICINNLLRLIFSHFLWKAIVNAQGSNYASKLLAEGANQNAQRPFFNTEIILKRVSGF